MARWWMWRACAVVGVGCAAAIGARGVFAGERGAGRSAAVERAQPEDEGAVEEDLRHARALSRVFQRAAERIEPSVAHITTVSERVGRDFFGRRVRQQASGLGSGVVMTPDGYVLTNAHVVEGATQLVVRLWDGREFDARVVGSDTLRDVAVVKVDASGLRPAEFATEEELEVGEWVLAVGSPFGFEQTVTAGIVSAKGRGLGIASDAFKEGEDFIQTDAAINPGNSGGPLINLDGEVVGLNSAIFSRGGGSVGLGFAIPVDLALAVYGNIRDGGRVDLGWLGMELEEEGGEVLVARVVDGSPAERAGLREGDAVVRYRDRVVGGVDQLIRSIQFTPPGTEALVEVERGGEVVRLSATVEGRLRAEVEALGGREIRQLGLTVAPAEGERSGVVVLDVAPGGIAARAELQRGDVLEAVDGKAVEGLEEFVSALAGGGDEVRVDVRRGRLTGYTILRR